MKPIRTDAGLARQISQTFRAPVRLANADEIKTGQPQNFPVAANKSPQNRPLPLAKEFLENETFLHPRQPHPLPSRIEPIGHAEN